MIPKIFHHIWLGNKDIPDGCKDCLKIMKELHPDFQFILWKDNDAEIFMKNDFPEYYEKYNKLERQMMKIDYLRFFIVYKYGGIYTDLDYYMFRKYDKLDYEVVLPCSRETNDGIVEKIGNCIFAAIPQHDFFKKVINTLLTLDRSSVDFSIDKNLDCNILGTGPAFLTNCWSLYANKNCIYVPERKLFHPPTKLDNKYFELLKANHLYGIHLCTGLWRNNGG